MSDRDWYTPPPGGWGEQPPGQGRDANTRGTRQRSGLLTTMTMSSWKTGTTYRRRAPDGQGFEARRRAIFQVQGEGIERETNPFPQRENGPGGGGVLPNQGAPHPNVVFGVEPQGQAEAGAYQAPPHNDQGSPTPQLGKGTVGSPGPTSPRTYFFDMGGGPHLTK